MNVKSELHCPVKNRSDPEAPVLWCLESSGVKGCDVFPHLYSHHPSHPESGPGPGVLTRKLRCGVWGHSESGHYIGQENQYCFISSNQQIIKSKYWKSHNKLCELLYLYPVFSFLKTKFLMNGLIEKGYCLSISRLRTRAWLKQEYNNVKLSIVLM